MGKCPIGLDLWYEISVHDLRTGKRLRHRKGRCYSFVKQFSQILKMLMAGGKLTGVTDTGNTSRTLYPTSGGNFTLNAGSGTSTYGSQVGTGSTSAAITDYSLGTQIAHGTSSGQLQYSAVTFGATATDSTTTSIVVTRVFTNGSGGSITVNEIALSVLAVDTGSTNRFFLIARDVISATPVANGAALTLNYTLKTTV